MNPSYWSPWSSEAAYSCTVSGADATERWNLAKRIVDLQNTNFLVVDRRDDADTATIVYRDRKHRLHCAGVVRKKGGESAIVKPATPTLRVFRFDKIAYQSVGIVVDSTPSARARVVKRILQENMPRLGRRQVILVSVGTPNADLYDLADEVISRNDLVQRYTEVPGSTFHAPAILVLNDVLNQPSPQDLGSSLVELIVTARHRNLTPIVLAPKISSIPGLVCNLADYVIHLPATASSSVEDLKLAHHTWFSTMSGETFTDLLNQGGLVLERLCSGIVRWSLPEEPRPAAATPEEKKDDSDQPSHSQQQRPTASNQQPRQPRPDAASSPPPPPINVEAVLAPLLPHLLQSGKIVAHHATAAATGEQAPSSSSSSSNPSQAGSTPASPQDGMSTFIRELTRGILGFPSQ